MNKIEETGIEELRRVARAASMTRESAFDGLDPFQVVRVMRACWGSPWDILPDELTEDEKMHAAHTGTLDETANERLNKRFGG
jgi:hypothetical protein